jgi:hypothetical protein
MRKILLAIGVVSVLASVSWNPATAQPSACSVMTSGLEATEGVCETKWFKDYTACIDKNIPNWDPSGKVLRTARHFTPAAAVLSVLAECEPLARVFGEKFGNHFANILQAIANRRVAEAYGTDPLPAPPCEENFVEYGQKVDVHSMEPGDVAVPQRTYTFHGEIRRP